MSELIITTREELTSIIQRAVSDAIQPFIAYTVAPTLPEDDTFINVEQAAAFLHKKPSTIYYLVKQRSVPVYKRGNRLLFKKDELQKMVEVGKRKTNDELTIVVKQHNY